MSSGDSIVFLGSGDVGLASLKELEKAFEIEAVITKANPKSSRAPRLVAEYAEQKGFVLFQPANKTELDELVHKKQFVSRLAVVVDYGIIIPKSTIEYFDLGILNSHFSLLPEWRGADPITFSLLSGQKVTGVSLMLIDEKLDEGDLLLQRKLEIADDETIETLTQRLIEMSNEMLLDTIPAFQRGLVHPFAQDETKHASYSRMLTKQDGEIDWQKSAEQIEREIRAFKGWPGSKTEIAGKRVTLLEATIEKSEGTPGLMQADNKTILVHCGQGSLRISLLKPDGKGPMTAEAFLAGNKL